MRFLNNIELLVGTNTPDIVEKTDFGFYLGYFERVRTKMIVKIA